MKYFVLSVIFFSLISCNEKKEEPTYNPDTSSLDKALADLESQKIIDSNALESMHMNMSFSTAARSHLYLFSSFDRCDPPFNSYRLKCLNEFKKVADYRSKRIASLKKHLEKYPHDKVRTLTEIDKVIESKKAYEKSAQIVANNRQFCNRDKDNKYVIDAVEQAFGKSCDEITESDIANLENGELVLVFRRNKLLSEAMDTLFTQIKEDSHNDKKFCDADGKFDKEALELIVSELELPCESLTETIINEFVYTSFFGDEYKAIEALKKKLIDDDYNVNYKTLIGFDLVKKLTLKTAEGDTPINLDYVKYNNSDVKYRDFIYPFELMYSLESLTIENVEDHSIVPGSVFDYDKSGSLFNGLRHLKKLDLDFSETIKMGEYGIRCPIIIKLPYLDKFESMNLSKVTPEAQEFLKERRYSCLDISNIPNDEGKFETELTFE